MLKFNLHQYLNQYLNFYKQKLASNFEIELKFSIQGFERDNLSFTLNPEDLTSCDALEILLLITDMVGTKIVPFSSSEIENEISFFLL